MSFSSEDEDLSVEVWLEPDGKLLPHKHPIQTERWSVVEGEARIRLGNEERVIGPADGEILVEPGVIHGLASVGVRDAHLRCVASPALRLQEFLEESSAAARGGLFNSKGLPRGFEGAKWAARFLKKYREETVFVSPPPFVQRILISLLARRS